MAELIVYLARNLLLSGLTQSSGWKVSRSSTSELSLCSVHVRQIMVLAKINMSEFILFIDFKRTIMRSTNFQTQNS